MEVHILSNGIKTQGLEEHKDKPNRKRKNNAGNRKLNGKNERKQQIKLIYRMELKEHEGRTLIEGRCWILRIGRTLHATWFLDPR